MHLARAARIGLLSLLPCDRTHAQVRADPGAVVDGRVVVRITATLSDSTEPYHPVRGIRLRVTQPGRAADSASVLTDEAGVATLRVPPGSYRLASVAPVDWHARWYAWDMPLVVRAGMAPVSLTSQNATPPGGTAMTVITGRPQSVAPPRPAPAAPPRADTPQPRVPAAGGPERASFRLFTGTIGFLHTPEDDGMSMSLGLGGVLARRLVGFVFPVDLGIVRNKDDRYYTDTFDNGNSVCRDSETGRFADKSNCAADIIYAASAEAGFALATGRHPVYLTGGYRVGARETAFGAISLAFQPLSGLHWYGKASIGRDFVQVVLGGSVPF